jgi:hypothetical protein
MLIHGTKSKGLVEQRAAAAASVPGKIRVYVRMKVRAYLHVLLESSQPASGFSRRALVHGVHVNKTLPIVAIIGEYSFYQVCRHYCQEGQSLALSGAQWGAATDCPITCTSLATCLVAAGSGVFFPFHLSWCQPPLMHVPFSNTRA